MISEVLSGLTANGIGRLKYMPYKMDVALSVVKRICQGIEPEFDSRPEIEDVYKQLIMWFHGDAAFNGDLYRGIMLMGPTGTGKTLAMKVMNIYRQIDDIKFLLHSRIYRMNYDIIDVNCIVNAFLNNAFEGVDMYCSRYILCIDDIGSEMDRVKHYGNTLDVISYIIAERYTKRLLTFGTTNFPIRVLEEKYDDRIISRMYALFNFIEMKSIDFRRH